MALGSHSNYVDFRESRERVRQRGEERREPRGRPNSRQIEEKRLLYVFALTVPRRDAPACLRLARAARTCRKSRFRKTLIRRLSTRTLGIRRENLALSSGAFGPLEAVIFNAIMFRGTRYFCPLLGCCLLLFN